MPGDDDDSKTGKGRLENGPWTKQDGSTFHKQMRDEAWERYEFAESKVSVETEQELGLWDSDGNYLGYGFADLVIEDKHVIDYKTDQMDTWTESTARARGHLYGSKAAAYANSPQLDSDAEGHLFMVGNRSEHDHINEIFCHAAAEHGVSVTFCDSADPQAVMDQIEERFTLVRRDLDVPVAVEFPLTEMVDASAPPQPMENLYGRRQFELVKGLVKVDEAASVAFGETFAEVAQPDPGFHAPDPSPYAPDGDFTTALFFGIQIGLKQAKESRLGQYIAEQYESFQDSRLAKQIEVVPRELTPEIEELAAAEVEPVVESQEVASEEVAAEEVAAPDQIELVDTSPDFPSEQEAGQRQELDPTPGVDPEPAAEVPSQAPGPDLDPTPVVQPDPEPEPEL